MKLRTYTVLTIVAIVAVAASLSGCGSAGSGSAAVPEQSQAAKADVTISARFPVSGGVVKSLLPAGTQVIEVSAYQPGTQTQPSLIATLTPAAPAKTVKMGAGLYIINAIAYSSADTATRSVLGYANTGGEIQLGVTNNVNLTFLNGQWTLVDANDSPAPMVLSDGTQFIDFIVGGNQDGMYKAGKSAIDYTKPFDSRGGMVRLRFDNNTSARTYGGMMSQFIGSTTSNLLYSDSYNLTKKCGYYSYYALPCDEAVGDRIIMISGKDNGRGQDGGGSEGSILYGHASELLPNKGMTTFSQNGQSLDLMAALPDTVVTAGNTITGGIVEWKTTSPRTTILGVPAAGKAAKSVRAVKAQSTNTPYVNMSVKDYETIVCSGTKPQNRGSWSFANNTSAGKVVLGGKVCYTNYPYLGSQYNPATMQSAPNAGDYSFGLVPASVSNLGDYCHDWDYTGNSCRQQQPGTGDIYRPDNFKAVKSAAKTAINYGSFTFNFWGETVQTGTAYVYPFRAKGSPVIKAAPAAPTITGLSVPAVVSTGATAAVPLTAAATDPNGDTITWSWSVISGGGTLGSGCSGSGASPVSSSCTFTPPLTAASVVLRFTASDGVRSASKDRTLSVSDGTSVVIQ